MECASKTVDAGLVPCRALRKRVTLDGIRTFIEDHYAERLSLEDLAARAQLSVFRFVKVFREHVGVSPYRFVSQVRVQRAKRLLLQGVPPAIAAIEVGLCDQSHLCRHFRSICGMTPGQFLASRPSAPYAQAVASRPSELRALS